MPLLQERELHVEGLCHSDFRDSGNHVGDRMDTNSTWLCPLCFLNMNRSTR